MRHYALILLALAVMLSAVGCQYTRDGVPVSWGEMTLQEQLEVAEFGLQVAREAYWTYLEHTERRDIEPDPARVDSLEQRVMQYVGIVAQIREALQPPEVVDG